MDDLISRQAAVELIERMKPYHQDADDIAEMIANMPSAQPERKTGKWVKYDGDWFKTMFKCSECGAMIDINEKYRNFFCYHCGADMLKNRWKKTRNYEGIGDDIAEECELYLKQVPSAQQWIPCSERLPKVREWVFCQCRAGIMDVLRLTEDGSWDKNYPHAEYMSGFVIAWCPLPEPWKGEQE